MWVAWFRLGLDLLLVVCGWVIRFCGLLARSVFSCGLAFAMVV